MVNDISVQDLATIEENLIKTLNDILVMDSITTIGKLDEIDEEDLDLDLSSPTNQGPYVCPYDQPDSLARTLPLNDTFQKLVASILAGEYDDN